MTAINGTEDGGHPQQCDQASAEADAAEHGENDQDEQPHAEADQHLGRSQFAAGNLAVASSA